VGQIDILERNVQRTAKLLPGLPVTEALLSRVILLVGRVLSAHIDEAISPYQLTDVEFRTLLALFSVGDDAACAGDLCAGLAQSPASMTRIGDNLVARKLITRVLSAEDRRRMDIKITPQGAALVREVLPRMFDYTRDLYRDFTKTERTRLLADLKKLYVRITQGEATGAKGAQA
jgi:MarR family transcriptional regulator, negative regulator of the multidrug operon emrRAB